jgi:putative glutamine amidotransferase
VRRALVGITLGDGDRPGYHSMRADYAWAVERSGAVPVVLPPLAPEHAENVLDRLDGLLLSGGVDVDPALYGRPRHPKLGRVDRERDEFELALTRHALRRDLPILAICRGQQVLNVAAGGTLIQDIPSELEGGAVTHEAPGRRTRRSHPVEVVAGSKLAEILGPGPLSVNSFHHQAIDRLGEGLTVTGRCPGDGVIEAVEMRDRSFVVAVQWHPESFWKEPVSFQALFDAHTAASRVSSMVRSR